MTAHALTRSLLSLLAVITVALACAAPEHNMPGIARKQGLVEYNDAQQQQPPVTAQQQPPSRGAQSDTAARGGKAPELAERVWLNTASKVYHCAGTAMYGTTKDGKYISEADARAQGNRPALDIICGPIRVWVNTASGVYHCPGSANYGTTAAGKYMTEPEARKANMRPSNGRICAP